MPRKLKGDHTVERDLRVERNITQESAANPLRTMKDLSGAVDKKTIREVVSSGNYKLYSVNDDDSTNVDNILVVNLESGNIGIGVVPTNSGGNALRIGLTTTVKGNSEKLTAYNEATAGTADTTVGARLLLDSNSANTAGQSTIYSEVRRRMTASTEDTAGILSALELKSVLDPDGGAVTYTHSDGTMGVADLVAHGIQNVGSGSLAISHAAALYVKANSVVGATNKYGLYIGTIAGSTNDYAIYTNTGKVRFGETVEIQQYLGVGNAPSSTVGAYIQNTDLTGTVQTGIHSSPISTAAATVSMRGIVSAPQTTDAVFTCENLTAFMALDAAKGASSTITRHRMYYAASPTQGTNNVWGTDNLTFTGDYVFHFTSTRPSEFAGRAGFGGSASANAIVRVGATNPLGGTIQRGFAAEMEATSNATNAVVGVLGNVTTAAASFTTAYLAQLQASDRAKGSGSTITRKIGIHAPMQTGGTNNAILVDNTSFVGNFGINLATMSPSEFAGRMGIGGSSSSGAVLQIAASNPITSVEQSGIFIPIVGSSDATTAIFGVQSYPTTADETFTCALVTGYTFYDRTKGAASTITRHIGYYGAQPTQGTYNTFISDDDSFTDDYSIYLVSSRPSYLGGDLSIDGDLNITGALNADGGINDTSGDIIQSTVGSFFWNIDSNDDSSDEVFEWASDRVGDSGGDILMRLTDENILYLFDSASNGPASGNLKNYASYQAGIGAASDSEFGLFAGIADGVLSLSGDTGFGAGSTKLSIFSGGHSTPNKMVAYIDGNVLAQLDATGLQITSDGDAPLKVISGDPGSDLQVTDSTMTAHIRAYNEQFAIASAGTSPIYFISDYGNGSTSADFIWKTDSTTLNTPNGTELMRLTDGGNLLIGITAPDGIEALHVKKSYSGAGSFEAAYIEAISSPSVALTGGVNGLIVYGERQVSASATDTGRVHALSLRSLFDVDSGQTLSCSNSSASTIYSTLHVQAPANTGSGTVNLDKFAYISISSNTHLDTGTDKYAIYIDQIWGATNNWGIYQTYGGNNNYFAGPIRAGTTGGITDADEQVTVYREYDADSLNPVGLGVRLVLDRSSAYTIANSRGAEIEVQRSYGSNTISEGHDLFGSAFRALFNGSGSYTNTSNVMVIRTISPSFSGGGTVSLNSYMGMFICDVSTSNATNQFGLYIGNQTGGSSQNYAIYTNDGAVRFGEQVTVEDNLGRGLTIKNPNANSQARINMYASGDTKSWWLGRITGAEGMFGIQYANGLNSSAQLQLRNNADDAIDAQAGTGRFAAGGPTIQDTDRWIMLGLTDTSQTVLTGTSQVGTRMAFRANSNATTMITGAVIDAKSDDASFATTDIVMLDVGSFTLGAGHTCTDIISLLVRPQPIDDATNSAYISTTTALESGDWFIHSTSIRPSWLSAPLRVNPATSAQVSGTNNTLLEIIRSYTGAAGNSHIAAFIENDLTTNASLTATQTTLEVKHSRTVTDDVSEATGVGLGYAANLLVGSDFDVAATKTYSYTDSGGYNEISIATLNELGAGTTAISNYVKLRIKSDTGSNSTNKYGILIDDISGASNLNYAIRTSAGQVYHADNTGIGAYPDPDMALRIGWSGNATDINQYGIYVGTEANSNATTSLSGIAILPTTDNAAFTCARVFNVRALAAQAGAGSTIQYAISYNSQTQTVGSVGNAVLADNYSFSGDYGINLNTTRQNYFGGPIRVNDDNGVINTTEMLSVTRNYNGNAADSHTAVTLNWDLDTDDALTGGQSCVLYSRWKRTIDANVTDAPAGGFGAIQNMQISRIYDVDAAATYTLTDADGMAAIRIPSVSLSGGGTLAVSQMYGIYIHADSIATGINKYGLRIGGMTGATNNYAIYTGIGLVHFGGDVEIDGGELLVGDGTGLSTMSIPDTAGGAPYLGVKESSQPVYTSIAHQDGTYNKRIGLFANSDTGNVGVVYGSSSDIPTFKIVSDWNDATQLSINGNTNQITIPSGDVDITRTDDGSAMGLVIENTGSDNANTQARVRCTVNEDAARSYMAITRSGSSTYDVSWNWVLATNSKTMYLARDGLSTNIAMSIDASQNVEIPQILGVGGTSGSGSIVRVGQNNPLSGTSQYGVTIEHAATSAATTSAIGVFGSVTTANASFTCGILRNFFSNNPTLGAASTVTRRIGYGGIMPTGGTNNAFISDNISFTSDWGINLSTSNPSRINGDLRLNTASAIIGGYNKLTVYGDYGAGSEGHSSQAIGAEGLFDSDSPYTVNSNSGIYGQLRRNITTSVTDTGGYFGALTARLAFNVASAQTYTNAQSPGFASVMINSPQNYGSGTLAITHFAGLWVNSSSLATGSYKYGIYVGSQSGASNNYAIYTNNGDVRFGDDAEVVGKMGVGGAASSNAILRTGYANPLTGTNQRGFAAEMEATSNATTHVVGYLGNVTTEAASFTTPYLAQFQASDRGKGSGSTITRKMAFYAQEQTGGTNNAIIADNLTFSGDYCLHFTNTNPSHIYGRIGIGGSAHVDTALAIQRPSNIAAANEYAVFVDYVGSSSATTSIRGYTSQVTTAAASYTCSILTHFGAYDITKGAGSTITRQRQYWGQPPEQGTNNAWATDNATFTGDWHLHFTNDRWSLLPKLQLSATETSDANARLFVKNGDDGLAVADSVGAARQVILESNTGNFVAFRRPDSNYSGFIFNEGTDGDAAQLRHRWTGTASTSGYEFRTNNAQLFRIAADGSIYMGFDGSSAASYLYGDRFNLISNGTEGFQLDIRGGDTSNAANISRIDMRGYRADAGGRSVQIEAFYGSSGTNRQIGEISFNNTTTDPTTTGGELEMLLHNTSSLGTVLKMTASSSSMIFDLTSRETLIQYSSSSGVYMHLENQYAVSSTGAYAQFLIETNNDNADPYVNWRINDGSTVNWSAGIENGVNNRFKICPASGLGTDLGLTIGTTGTAVLRRNETASLAGVLDLTNTNATSVANGIGMRFQAHSTDDVVRTMGEIYCVKEQVWTSTSTTRDAQLRFYTSLNGTTGGAGQEALILDSAKEVYFPNISTTGSAANAFLDSGNSNQLLRSTSSARYKMNIEDMNIDSSKIFSLRPVEFDDRNRGTHHFGLVAEEVAEILPELVQFAPEKCLIPDSDSDKKVPDGVQYQLLSVLLLNEVKKLNKEIEKIKSEKDTNRSN